jgi:hypothetical protein
MSIKLRFEKGSLTTQVILKDEAFSGLLDLISKHQSDEVSAPAAPISPAAIPSEIAGDSDAVAKHWIPIHSPSEILNLIGWSTNSEKILLLGAYHEISHGEDSWRSADMEERFAEARESFPSNFPRDIRVAIREGLITSVTPRTYRVSRTGWNRLADAITKLSTV